jgi:hypothetical protein
VAGFVRHKRTQREFLVTRIDLFSVAAPIRPQDGAQLAAFG